MQRRCATKDSNPNMLDLSCAGHLSAGDDSITAALRELKEELNLDVKSEKLKFIKTIKRSLKYTETFINNEFDDMYILRTNKTISEIFFVSYNKFKEMIKSKQEDLLMHTVEFKILFELFDNKFNN